MNATTSSSHAPRPKLELIMAGVGVLSVLVTALWLGGPTSSSRSTAPSEASVVMPNAATAPRTAAPIVVAPTVRVSPSFAVPADDAAPSEAIAELAEAVAEFEPLPPDGPHEQLISDNIRDLQVKADAARRDGDEAYAARLELRVSALNKRLARVQIDRTGERP